MITIGTTPDGKATGLPLEFANRHGLVTGATGTGKTVTLQRLAEGFSAAGVPVFAADIKGDLSGIATAAPTEFWDVFGHHGHPIRTSMQDMGAVLVSRMLGLNEVQAGTLAIAFQRAEDERNFLLGIEDLRWSLRDMADDRGAIEEKYGHITGASIATIQRQLLALEVQGGANLFGEPALDIADFMRTTPAGRGIVNLLHADKLMESPKLYATLLLWLLTELFRKLPEVGDIDKPKLVFFFDEAHLLFKDAPKALLDHIERVVRLVRSKGVGVYFVAQSPADVPDTVLAQLGNRVQHALRAYTARDQRMVKAAVRSFRANPAVDVAKSVLEMGVGEALVSCLEADGIPAPVERIRVTRPNGQIGPLSEVERRANIESSMLYTRYPRGISDAVAHLEFDIRMAMARGIEPPKPEPARAPIDWDKALAPIDALAAQPVRLGWSLPAKLLALWLTACALFALGGWLFPQV